MKNWQLPRRTFLRSLGGTLLLPTLEGMFHNDAAAATVSPRFAAFFMSLGIYGMGYDLTKSGTSRYFQTSPAGPDGLGAWLPKNTGALNDPLPPILQPLESLKKKLAILSGLGTLPGDPQDNGVNHSTATTAWLTAAWASKKEAIASNIDNSGGSSFTAGNETPPDSIDQYIANAMNLTAGSTLVLNTDSGNYSEKESGGHGGHISYNSKLSANGSSKVPKTIDPMKAFDVLFGNCKKNQVDPAKSDNLSVIDFVKADIERVQKKVGTADKARLDAYFQNIRDLETKLVAVQKECVSRPLADPAYSGGKLDWVTNMNLMVDIVALALSSGQMPVASLMTSTEASDDQFASRVEYLSEFVGVGGQKIRYHAPTLGTHFDIAHVDSNNVVAAEEHIAYSHALLFFVKRLLIKLDSMPLEPNGGTPLDNCIVLVGACHSHSGFHNTHNLPTLLAGGKSFGLAQGQYVAMPNNSDIGDFYNTMARAMGIAGTSFNGHSKILSGIFDKIG